MAQKFVGIDIGTHRIKMAVVSSGLRGVQVLDAFEEAVGAPQGEADAEHKADTLSHALAVCLSVMRSRGLLHEAIGICLPAGDVSYRMLNFPFHDERKIAPVLAFQADGEFAVPIEELNYDHTVFATPDGGGRALIAAAKQDRIDKIVSIFRRAGADVKVVTSGAMAAGQVATADAPPILDEVEEGVLPVTLMVDLGHKYTQFAALGPKGPLAVRTQRRGSRAITEAVSAAFELDMTSAEEAKLADAFLPHRGLSNMSEEQLDAGRVVAEAFEPTLREIEHTRLWLRSTYRLEVTKIVLAGGGAGLNGLDAYINEQTGLPVEPLRVGDPKIKNLEGREWTSTAAALGAAVGAARRPLIQLYDAAGGAAGGGWIQEKMSGLVAIGVAIMAFGALDTIAQVKAAQAELDAHKAELEDATKATFGQSMTPEVVDTTLQNVGGEDLMSLIPRRGALEVLAMIAEAARPSDLDTAPKPTSPAVAGPGGVALPGLDLPPGIPLPPGMSAPGATPAATPEPAPVDKSQGIVVADALSLKTVDIRELKIELDVRANTSSAQDRLIYKLKQLGCLSDVLPGKVKGERNQKAFQMSMTNGCYRTEAEAETEESTE